jgi:DNA-binding response OmpR family regulator
MATVLIVEDEPVMGTELRHDLMALGHEVCEILPDADRVTAVVAMYHPDIIIMDIKLFGFRDGVDAAQQVRLFYSTPIIFLSSYLKADVQARTEKVANSTYLEKPYDVVKLQKAILAFLPTEKA